MVLVSSLVLILAAYLWGSLSPAFLAARTLKGIDLRRYGSGNIGSSNIREQLGFRWMIAIGATDLAKGLAPVVIARGLGFDLTVQIGAGLAALIGHNWSVFLRFAGGRGMATTIGVLLAWDARLTVALLLILAAGQFLKQGALASIIGLLALAPSAWFFQDAAGLIAASALLAVIVAIKRLEANRLPLPRDGREKRVVLWRRFWLDRDVPPNQMWEKRKRIEG